MSSAKERLEKAKENSFLVGLAAGARTPKQLDKAVENLREQGVELTEEERKEAREIAKKKRDDKKTFKAILSKVLEKARKTESKMTLKERLEKFKREGQFVEVKHDDLTRWSGRLVGRIINFDKKLITIEAPLGIEKQSVIIPLKGTKVKPCPRKKAFDFKKERLAKIKRAKILAWIIGSTIAVITVILGIAFHDEPSRIVWYPIWTMIATAVIASGIGIPSGPIVAEEPPIVTKGAEETLKEIEEKMI